MRDVIDKMLLIASKELGLSLIFLVLMSVVYLNFYSSNLNHIKALEDRIDKLETRLYQCYHTCKEK